MTLTDKSWREVWNLLDWGYTHSQGLGCTLQTEDRKGLLLAQAAIPLKLTTDN